MSDRVAVGIGSNLGDRSEALRFAARELERRLTRLALSSVYRSDPAEGARGGEYLNMCAAGRWARGSGASPAAGARALLEELRHVEAGAGRPPDRPAGAPRTLDLDLLLYGPHRIRAEGLEVPHPRLAERPFVLYPLAELIPAGRHPGEGRTIAELASACESDDVRRAGA